MKMRLPTRFALLLTLLTPSVALSQTSSTHTAQKPSAAIPATHPASTLPATPPTAATPLLPPPPVQNAPKKAAINFERGLLEVRADNSSLNQILREISRTTGMRITGGVGDERVFGTYGPLPTSNVLTLLLNGTGTNLVFLQSTVTAAPELILTARQGGPTPPNPNARGFDGNRDDENVEQQPNPSPAPIAVRPTPPAEGNPADQRQQQSPNGVRNPQQMFDRLQRSPLQLSRPQ